MYSVYRVLLCLCSLVLPFLFVDSISSRLISLRFLSEYECQYHSSRLVSYSYTVIDSNTFPLPPKVVRREARSRTSLLFFLSLSLFQSFNFAQLPFNSDERERCLQLSVLSTIALESNLLFLRSKLSKFPRKSSHWYCSTLPKVRISPPVAQSLHLTRLEAIDENTSLVQLALVEKGFASIALPLLYESLEITSFSQLAKVVKHRKKKETKETKYLSIRFVGFRKQYRSRSPLAYPLFLLVSRRSTPLASLKLRHSFRSNPCSRLLPKPLLHSLSMFPQPLTIRSLTSSPSSQLFLNSLTSLTSASKEKSGSTIFLHFSPPGPRSSPSQSPIFAATVVQVSLSIR